MNPLQSLVLEKSRNPVIDQSIIDRRESSRTKRAKLRIKRREKALDARTNNTIIGSSSYVPSKAGFKGKRLPKHFPVLINRLKALVYSGEFDPITSGAKREWSVKCRTKLLEILIVIITRTDLVSRQVGVPDFDGFNAIKHDDLLLAHAVRFGYSMSSTTWFRYINVIKSHNILQVIEAKSHVCRGKVKSYAGYKWLSDSFLKKLGADQDDIKISIERANNKTVKSGRSFKWKLVHTKQIRKHHDQVNYELDLDAPPPAGSYIQ